MWLAGEQRQSFVTLAGFRRRLNGTIKNILKEIVGLSIRAGMVRKEQIYINHTKMEANSNRHRVVWRKRVEKYLGRAEAELERLLELIDRLNEEEQAECEQQVPIDTLTPQMLDELIERVNQRVKAREKARSEAAAQKRQLRRSRQRWTTSTPSLSVST